MFQIDLNIDLIKEPEEQVFLHITLNRSQSQCGQVCLDMCSFFNMPEYA